MKPTEKADDLISLVMPRAESLVESVAATTGAVAVLTIMEVTVLEAVVPAPSRLSAVTATPPFVIADETTLDFVE